MRLSISNIIWPAGEEHLGGFLDLAERAGLSGVEIALSCFWDEPADTDAATLSQLKAELSRRGLDVSALHSLTFTRPDLEIFGTDESREALIRYTGEYLRMAEELDCENLVFGSPKCRRMHGRSLDECTQIFAEFLGRLDRLSSGVRINIEPLPVSQCEYLNTFAEAAAICEAGNYQNVFVQLDVRSCIDNGETPEDIRARWRWVRHCQVSDPGLKPPGTGEAATHRQFGELLREMNYAGYVAAEVVRPETEFEGYMRNCIDQLKRYYA